MFNINKIKLPSKSGCYLMKNQSGQIIYIGKAKNLAKRVKSYFQKNDSDWKTSQLLTEIRDIETIITRNEAEALLLEARLIKQHQPKYNFKLKENQPFMYIKITNEELPRLVSVRRIEGPGKYFGPFVSGRGRRYLLLLTARLFGLRTDKFISRSSRELYKLLSEIRDRNLGEISTVEYRQNVKLAELFLKGRKEQLLEQLEKRMKLASSHHNFELARVYRDQIRSIKILSAKQLVSLPKDYDQDVINYVVVDQQAIFQVFNVKQGVITSRHEIQSAVDRPVVISEVLASFIQQYYLTRVIPRELIIPQKIKDASALADYLNQLKGSRVVITVPQKGDKKELLALVRQNVINKMSWTPAQELQAQCHLPVLPVDIDGFDVSNITGRLAVGSCVRFTNGWPNKKLYRRFKIRTVVGPNDYAMMLEIISRRYHRTGWGLPDLILVDGGRGQLNVALKVLAGLGLDIPIVSLAKKKEEIYIPQERKPIILDPRSGGRLLLQRIRDEAHRFAINYHKLLR
ncbi:MAG: excinuclease ABC subunit UvrC [Patescibacteria group bacterium]